jgi:hypothetical protein
MGLFDFNANEPLSYEALQTRRKIAEQMAGRRAQPYPKNVGEGIFSAADSLADAYGQKSLEAKLAAYEKGYQADVDKRYQPGAVPATPLVIPGRPTPGRPTPVRQSDIDPFASPNTAYAAPPMGETFNMANYDLHRPEDMYA